MKMQSTNRLSRPDISTKYKDLLNKFAILHKKSYLSKIDFNSMFTVSNTLLHKLRLHGICRVFSDTTKYEKENALLLPFAYAAAFLGILGIINNFIHKSKVDIRNALEIAPVIFGAVFAWLAGILLYLEREKITRLLGNMKTSWIKELQNGIDDATINIAKRSIFLTVIYAKLIYAVGAFYFTAQFVRTMKQFITDEDAARSNLNMRLSIRYPFSIDSLPTYILCVTFEAVCTFILITSYLSIDTLFFQLTTTLSLLLQIAGERYAKLTLYNDVKKVDHALLQKLENMGKQHSELLSYCQRIEEIFNPIIFTIIIFTSGHLCVCVAAMESKLSGLQLIDAVILMFHLLVITIQPYIYCNAAEDIAHRTNNIAEAIYTCRWPDQSQKFKKMVLLVMMRSHRNYKFKAYGLYKVNRYLLTQLVHTAFNFFMLLRKSHKIIPARIYSTDHNF